MTNLVHRQFLRPIELSIWTHRIFFQEEPDFITGVEEVVVPNMSLFRVVE